ncbi:hypothetical protein QVD17_39391 [Tagetes erecta]|uniref:Uncharacterized protein n=1 Tax=Tagetes erecta TaxID=13708 RepID=A0AAD8NF89_TARER|nr:hypothetical protein QVD17_39391 [Tagetes erecta]
MLVTNKIEEEANMIERLTMAFKDGVYDVEIAQIMVNVFTLIELKKNNRKARRKARIKEEISAFAEISAAEMPQVQVLDQAITEEEENLKLAEQLDSRG